MVCCQILWIWWWRALILGANLGDDVLYSGTVAAALEGRFLQLPSFAFSLLSRQPHNLASAARFARCLIESHSQLS